MEGGPCANMLQAILGVDFYVAQCKHSGDQGPLVLPKRPSITVRFIRILCMLTFLASLLITVHGNLDFIRHIVTSTDDFDTIFQYSRYRFRQVTVVLISIITYRKRFRLKHLTNTVSVLLSTAEKINDQHTGLFGSCVRTFEKRAVIIVSFGFIFSQILIELVDLQGIDSNRATIDLWPLPAVVPLFTVYIPIYYLMMGFPFTLWLFVIMACCVYLRLITVVVRKIRKDIRNVDDLNPHQLTSVTKVLITVRTVITNVEGCFSVTLLLHIVNQALFTLCELSALSSLLQNKDADSWCRLAEIIGILLWNVLGLVVFPACLAIDLQDECQKLVETLWTRLHGVHHFARDHPDLQNILTAMLSRPLSLSLGGFWFFDRSIFITIGGFWVTYLLIVKDLVSHATLPKSIRSCNCTI